MRWYMSVISVLGSLRWEGEDDEFEASMGYTVRSRLPSYGKFSKLNPRARQMLLPVLVCCELDPESVQSQAQHLPYN